MLAIILSLVFFTSCTPQPVDTDDVLYCGCTEHIQHTKEDGCYQTNTILICDIPESDAHEHTDACYGTQDVLTCTRPLHTHSLQCRSNPKADLETSAIWEQTLGCAELNGNWVHDITAIAITQLGYQESSQNYELNQLGGLRGYTRYGAWYGFPYTDWDAMFCAFCYAYAGVPSEVFPNGATAGILMTKLQLQNMYREAYYLPAPGDLVFLNTEKGKRRSLNASIPDHVGIVVSVTRDERGIPVSFSTIDGDCNDAVCYNIRDLKDPAILGYGILPKSEPAAPTE